MSIRILIVDEDALSREVLKGLLDAPVYHIEEANKGELALKMTANKHYDVVFMNMRMSDLSSPEVAHRIRIHEYNNHTHCPAKIIAICDRFPKSKHFDWSHSGFDHSIGKPLNEKDIIHAIRL